MARAVFSPALLSPATDPVAVLDALAVSSPAKARVGLSMAIGDLVEMTWSWPVLQVEEIDSALIEDGLPSLTEMRVRFSKVVRRALRRGRIKDEVEYQAVRNAAELGGDEAEKLWSVLAAYEGRP